MKLICVLRSVSLWFLILTAALGIACDDGNGSSGSQNSGSDSGNLSDVAPGGINNSGGDSGTATQDPDSGGQLGAQDSANGRGSKDTGTSADTAVGEDSNSGGTDTTEVEADLTESEEVDTTAGTVDSTEPIDAGGPIDESPLVNWCQIDDDKFSFFVTSMAALWTLSGDELSNLSGGFGGNYGGIAGADKICQTIGAAVGHGDKTWRAFLSATDDGQGNQVHAIDRIGKGPWYDANGRLVATGIAGLQKTRPDGDILSTDDLPDECGIPLSIIGDVHDIPTGSNALGKLNNTNKDSTCNDWTSSSGTVGSTGGGKAGGTVMCGHSFPREVEGGGGPGGGPGGGGKSWVSDHPLRGCGKGANLLQNGPGTGTCIGCSGGYGGLYCFAL